MKDLIKNKKVAITGGAGFIGSNLARFLCEQNEVIIIDNLILGYEKNFEDIKESITFCNLNINETKKVTEALSGVDFVFHMAALGSVPRSVADPITTNIANIDGTLSLLVAARDAGVKRVIYSASSSAYGESKVLPKVEDMPSDPVSPYGVTKYVGELYCRVFSKVYEIETVSLRYMNIFGPYQNIQGAYAAVIPKFIDAILKGKQPTIYGDGEHTRDFTFIDNALQANIRAAITEGISGEMFNIACGQQTSLLELLEKINKALGTSVQPIFEEARKGDIKHGVANISKAKEVLGYNPDTDLDEQIKKTAEWYRKELI